MDTPETKSLQQLVAAAATPMRSTVDTMPSAIDKMIGDGMDELQAKQARATHLKAVIEAARVQLAETEQGIARCEKVVAGLYDAKGAMAKP